MKITFRNLVRLGAVGLIAATIGLAGCKSSGERTTGQKMSDRQVAKGVKKELGNDSLFKYPNVQANVFNGNVQLTGFVQTPEQRLRAAELAAKAKGARQVINNVMLQPAPTGPATIRDPFGHETGKLLIDTNAPAPNMQQMIQGAPQQQSQQPQQQR